MCRLTGQTLQDATDSLLNANLGLADRVNATDAELNQIRANAEAIALDLLVEQALMATDLRTVLSALWIVADLPRMGAFPIHIAKGARQRHPANATPSQVRLIAERMERWESIWRNRLRSCCGIATSSWL